MVSMAKTNVPKKVLDLLAEVGLSTHQAGWDCHGTWVMYHKAAEKLAGYKKVKFDKPEIIHQDVGQKEVVMLVTGHCGDITEWSFGEATPSNNKNAYPYAMAEKRAKDRVILKLLGFHGDVYTDTEIDDQVQQQLKRQAERNIENTSEQEVKEQEESSTSNTSSPVPISSSKMFEKIKKLYPKERLFAGPLEKGPQMVSYSKAIEDEMADYCREELERFIPESKFFACTPGGPE